MIGSASFQPQAAAFTSLLHMCAKAKLWQKALEVRHQNICPGSGKATSGSHRDPVWI